MAGTEYDGCPHPLLLAGLFGDYHADKPKIHTSVQTITRTQVGGLFSVFFQDVMMVNGHMIKLGFYFRLGDIKF